MTRSSEPERPDQALLAEFRGTGDHRAFEALIARHRDSIRRFLYACLGRSAEIDEAEQETLVRLYGALRSFDARSSLLTFVYRICQRVAVDQIRRQQRERKKNRRFYLLREVGGEAQDGPHGETADEETRGEILAALNSLGEPDRSILYLRDAEDVSVAELARSFAMPEGTIKSRLHRSRKRLRPLLASLVHGEV